MISGEGRSYAPDDKSTEAWTYRQDRIRQLNDVFRTSFVGGRVMVTAGINALPPQQLASVLSAVREFAAFKPGNDPFDEHDFGAIDIAGERIFWKIDYYGKRLEFGSPDPADPGVTQRVLTIMLASEY